MMAKRMRSLWLLGAALGGMFVQDDGSVTLVDCGITKAPPRIVAGLTRSASWTTTSPPSPTAPRSAPAPANRSAPLKGVTP